MLRIRAAHRQKVLRVDNFAALLDEPKVPLRTSLLDAPLEVLLDTLIERTHRSFALLSVQFSVLVFVMQFRDH